MSEIPQSISSKAYLELVDKIREPLDELGLDVKHVQSLTFDAVKDQIRAQIYAVNHQGKHFLVDAGDGQRTLASYPVTIKISPDMQSEVLHRGSVG